MKKFKVKYQSGPNILVTEIKAADKKLVPLMFYLTYGRDKDIIKIEEVN